MPEDQQAPEDLLPGSDAAIAEGCECPRDQPQAFQDLYKVNGACPLHGLGDPREALLA